MNDVAKIRKYISNETTEILIHAFVNSKLHFCKSLFYGLSKYEINKLQNVQNAAARVVACPRKWPYKLDFKRTTLATCAPKNYFLDKSYVF